MVAGIVETIRTTIDTAGRIVIPKVLRDQLALQGGDELEIDALTNHLEIRRAGAGQALVEAHNGLRTMASGPGLSPDQVRGLLERHRR